jgi:hypothetical protein
MRPTGRDLSEHLIAVPCDQAVYPIPERFYERKGKESGQHTSALQPWKQRKEGIQAARDLAIGTNEKGGIRPAVMVARTQQPFGLLALIRDHTEGLLFTAHPFEAALGCEAHAATPVIDETVRDIL